MDNPYAFATLVTSDHYLPGALAVAAALKELHPSPPVPPEVPFQTVCLVTPETVDVSSIKLLRRAFDIVIGVEVIEQEDGKGLQLLGTWGHWVDISSYGDLFRMHVRYRRVLHHFGKPCVRSTCIL